MSYRVEKDSMGEVLVKKDKLWGAQTQRSLDQFKIGEEKMPIQIIRAFSVLKKAAALANLKLGKLDEYRADAIINVCDEILSGKWDDHFPLSVWQTGSGTQSNMNVNEVIANRCNIVLGEKTVHPNDHVNMSQSSNDTFPSAMHIAVRIETEDHLLPALEKLTLTALSLSKENENIVKIGRTHLQDAVPITLGQEISGWYGMLLSSHSMIRDNLKYIADLAMGGTAVGTGLNSPKRFGELAAGYISEITGRDFHTSPNKFHALTSRDGLVVFHGSLKALAANLHKIANDVRWLASGPRCGIGEIRIPENEPGSSIMPGKVNPTQCEAMSMVCCQVMGNDAALGFAASLGNFELNTYMPVMIHDALQSVRLLSDAMNSFNDNCVKGITPDHDRIRENLNKSLMLVTALCSHIGYDNSAMIARHAYEKGLTLREAAVSLGFIDADEFDRLVVPKEMTGI